MRVTAAFSRLLQLDGVWVRAVRFERRRVVVMLPKQPVQTPAVKGAEVICGVDGWTADHAKRSKAAKKGAK